MRNTGWYIPYWRKPKRKGKAEKPGTEEITRSDEHLESVRQRWVERYRRTVRALAVLGLSMGSNRGDVQSRYDVIKARGVPREIEDAYRYLMRVLPAGERRKKRPPAPAPTTAITATRDMSTSASALDVRDTVVTADGETETGVAIEVYVDEVDITGDGDFDDEESEEEDDADDGPESAATWELDESMAPDPDGARSRPRAGGGDEGDEGDEGDDSPRERG